jgi:hypothetical protein
METDATYHRIPKYSSVFLILRYMYEEEQVSLLPSQNKRPSTAELFLAQPMHKERETLPKWNVGYVVGASLQRETATTISPARDRPSVKC